MKYFIPAVLIALGETTMILDRPDAIRCGAPVGGGAIYSLSIGSRWDRSVYC